MYESIASPSTPPSLPLTSVTDTISREGHSRAVQYLTAVMFVALIYWVLTDRDGEGTRLLWYRFQSIAAHRIALPISSWGFKAEEKYQRTLDRNRTV